jgi:hypothetical protein
MSVEKNLIKILQQVTGEDDILTEIIKIKNAKRLLLCDIVSTYGITSGIRKIFSPWIVMGDDAEFTLQQRKIITNSPGGLGLFVLSTEVYKSIQFYLRLNDRIICIHNKVQTNANYFVILDNNNHTWKLFTIDNVYTFDKEFIPVSIDVLFSKCTFRQEDMNQMAKELIDYSLVPSIQNLTGQLLNKINVIQFYNGVKSTNTNIVRVLWDENLYNWIEIVKHTLPLPFEKNIEMYEIDTFQLKYSQIYDYCLKRVLESLGVQYQNYLQPITQSFTLIGSEAQEVAEYVVSSMVFILDQPGFVQEVSKLLHQKFFPLKSLELLIAQVESQKGTKQFHGRVEPVRIRYTLLNRILPELDMYRLSQLRSVQHECKSTTLNFLITSKLMLVALQQYVFTDFEYVGDVFIQELISRSENENRIKNEKKEQEARQLSIETNKRKHKGSKYIPSKIKKENQKKEQTDVQYLQEFIEDVLDYYTETPTPTTKPWIIVLTIPNRDKVYRRVALAFRHDIQVIFLFDPCRNIHVLQYIQNILEGELSWYKNYQFVTVVRQNMIDVHTTRYCSEWIPLFILTACTGQEKQEIIQRTMSRFNAEVRYLKDTVVKIELRLFAYITQVLYKYQKLMDIEIKDHFPQLIKQYSS